MEPKSCSVKNDARNWTSLKERVQDMVGGFKYLYLGGGCHIKGLDMSQREPKGHNLHHGLKPQDKKLAQNKENI